MLTQTLYSENETVLFGKKIAKNLRPGVFIALKGALGAGKTCLCRGILSGLGHTGHVKSPTYPLVEIYTLESSTIYHFDFYRITNPMEVIEAGFREVFINTNICLVEWPENAESVMRVPDITISIIFSTDSRDISVTAASELGKQCLKGLQ
jgi:tRNA threonylcarbamoyladenosine biosynthesis protein TsaE